MTTNGLKVFSRAAQMMLAAAGLAVAAGSAGAADMAVNSPMATAPFNYSGCFVGGYFGWGVANDWKTTDVNGFNPGGVNPWDFSLNTSATGGGYVGCSWQPSLGGGLVFGIDGQGGYLQLSAPGQQLNQVPGGVGTSFITDNTKLGSGYGVVAGRIGWVFLEKIHVYGKLGVGFYNETSTINNTALVGAPILASGSKSQMPLVWGIGAEFPLTEHWIGRAEYLFFENGSSYTSVGTGAGAGFNWNESPSTVQTFTLGAAYKF